MNQENSKYWSFILVVLIMLVVGAVHVSRHFLMPEFINVSGQVYYPVVFQAEFDQAVTYGPRVQAAYLGRQDGDVSLAEHEDSPSPLPLLNPRVLSVLATVSGSLESAFVLADFILPIIIFLLVYFFLYEIFKRNWAALTGSVVFIFVPTIGVLIPPVSFGGLKLLLYEFLPFLAAPDRLFFNRFEYPNVTFVFYLFALFFIYRSIKYGKRRDVILAGLGVGSLFYTYLYDWVYVFCGLAFMVALFFCQKNYQKTKILLSVILIALICSFYYWLNFFALTSLPQYADIASRVGLETGRFFRFFTWTTYLRGIFIVWLLWLVLKNKDRILWVYLSGLLLPIIVVLNLQILTGFNPQPDHWYRELFFPLFVSLCVLISWFCGKYKKYFTGRLIVILAIFVAIIILSGRAYTQYVYAGIYANENTIGIDSLDSYKWLTENTPANTVVAALSPETNVNLLLHTHNKVFYPSGVNSIASDKEIWERFMIVNLLFGISDNDFAQSIGVNQYMLIHLFHDTYNTKNSFNSYFKGGGFREIPTVERQEKIEEYKNIKENFSLGSLPYKIDYIYVDDRVVKSKPLGVFLGELLYDRGGIKIYKFKN